jgi:hypothetical protein
MLSASSPLTSVMIKISMTKMRTLAEILSKDDDSEELYHTDQQWRAKRASWGRFTKVAHTFDFIHLVKNWKDIVGAMLSENTIPLKIKNNQLYILTKHAVFSQELSFMEQMIIQKIEETFPNFKGKIKKIRFSTGDFSSEEFNNVQKQHEKQTSQKPKEPNRFDPNYRKKLMHAQKLFSDIEDEEMRELLIQAYLA